MHAVRKHEQQIHETYLLTTTRPANGPSKPSMVLVDPTKKFPAGQDGCGWQSAEFAAVEYSLAPQRVQPVVDGDVNCALMNVPAGQTQRMHISCISRSRMDMHPVQIRSLNALGE
jgi:hypothetical protein